VTVPTPSDPEDAKIITLARAARARNASAAGACVRDTDGRTYSATEVALPHLRLTAVAVAMAMASSSGATGLEAVAVSSEQPPGSDDLGVISDLPGEDVKVWHVDASGSVVSLTVLDSPQ
jgi:cytidine deaminase